MNMNRLLIAALAVTGLILGGTSAMAANGGATIVKSTATFVLTSATCPYLPSGTTVTGSGPRTSITTTRTDANGVTKLVNHTHAHGTATDQDGNVYVFNYSNTIRVTNTAAAPGVFSGTATDAFSLAGSGPAGLRNGFTADVTTDFSVFSWDVRHAKGDPISFTSGPLVQHCDPL
jgi:hypothetical protein